MALDFFSADTSAPSTVTDASRSIRISCRVVTKEVQLTQLIWRTIYIHPTHRQATSDLDLCGHGSTCTCDMRLTYTRSHLASELIHLAIRVVSSVTTWATVPQVETHVHASASMNVQRSLLDRRGTRSTLRAMTRLKIHRDPEASRSAQATRARSIRSRHAGLATIRPIAQASTDDSGERLPCQPANLQRGSSARHNAACQTTPAEAA